MTIGKLYIITKRINQGISVIVDNVVCYVAAIEEDIPTVLNIYHIESGTVMHIAVPECNIVRMKEAYQTIGTLIDFGIVDIYIVRIVCLDTIGATTVQPAVFNIHHICIIKKNYSSASSSWLNLMSQSKA